MRLLTPCFSTHLLAVLFLSPNRLLVISVFAWVASGLFVACGIARDGELTVTTKEAKSDKPLAARWIIRRADGKPARLPRYLLDGVGVAIPSEQLFRLPDGGYQFEVIRGPEYRLLDGTFAFSRDGFGNETIVLHRFVDMAQEGWISGDGLALRSAKDLPQLMQANDLHAVIAPQLVTTSTKTARTERNKAEGLDPWIRTDAIVDPRCPGLLIVGASGYKPLEKQSCSGELIRQAAEAKAEAIVITQPSDWDVPIWLASGRISAMAVLHPEVRLDRPGKIIGRQPSETGYLDEHAPGNWGERVWRMALEAGLRIPTIGLSGAAEKGNPVGYNRVYAHCNTVSGDDQPRVTPAEYWQRVWEGRSIVTNGPLMRPGLGGYLPGEVISIGAGYELQLAPELKLAVRDPVDYLEVIFNERSIYSARLDEAAKVGVKTPALPIQESGWVIFRVVTRQVDHWRVAISSPWWIDVGGQPRISRKACDFFSTWLEERATMLGKSDAATQAAAAPFLRAARSFWHARKEMANVD
jgi:hypothetical protein